MDTSVDWSQHDEPKDTPVDQSSTADPIGPSAKGAGLNRPREEEDSLSSSVVLDQQGKILNVLPAVLRCGVGVDIEPWGSG